MIIKSFNGLYCLGVSRSKTILYYSVKKSNFVHRWWQGHWRSKRCLALTRASSQAPTDARSPLSFTRSSRGASAPSSSLRSNFNKKNLDGANQWLWRIVVIFHGIHCFLSRVLANTENLVEPHDELVFLFCSCTILHTKICDIIFSITFRRR